MISLHERGIYFAPEDTIGGANNEESTPIQDNASGEATVETKQDWYDSYREYMSTREAEEL